MAYICMANRKKSYFCECLIRDYFIILMIQTRLKGMGVALITPFKEDESVDYDALMRLVDYQLQNNTDFLCVLGTTAETPTLTEEEKKKIKKMVIERVNGKIPILLGVGGNNTRAIVETLKNDDFTGVDAILSVFLIITSLPKKGFISIIKRFPRLPTFRLYFIMYRDVPE